MLYGILNEVNRSEMGSVFLSELLESIEALYGSQPLGGKPDLAAFRLPVRGISMDSRRLQPGEVFVALSGTSTDGHRFIPEAIGRGAAAIVGERALSGLTVPYLKVNDSRLVLALLAAAWHGFPARQLKVVGVTGTDGKTTTSTLIYNILKAAGVQAGMISTVSAFIGERALDTGFHVTTPEALEVQSYLAQMVDVGISYVVVEATSHGLAQRRVAACDFDIGVVTNITHEHLDYHGSYESYRQAKALLFRNLAESRLKPDMEFRTAVLNYNDDSYPYLAGLLRELNQHTTPPLRVVTYGLDPEADMHAENIVQSSQGLRFDAVWEGQRLPLESMLTGLYNVANCLAALAATMLGMGLDGQAAREGIRAVSGIPGRMEKIDMGQDFLAYVDFAHTPNALKQALTSARQLMGQSGRVGRLIAIFGSAGLRDRAKRRMMAEIAQELADVTILTAEDPRTESLDQILAEMAAGAEARGGVEGQTFWRVPDRRAAIVMGIQMARPGDLVIALGKGHEQSMCFGEIEFPWDDRIAMRAALAERLNLPGPAMPYLPDPNVAALGN